MFVSDTQLRGLEERGYLDPNLRGNRVDEADAVEAAYWFITVREQPSSGSLVPRVSAARA